MWFTEREGRANVPLYRQTQVACAKTLDSEQMIWLLNRTWLAVAARFMAQKRHLAMHSESLIWAKLKSRSFFDLNDGRQSESHKANLEVWQIFDLKQRNHIELGLRHPKNCTPPWAEASEAQQAQQQNHMTLPTENMTNEHRGTYLAVGLAKRQDCCRNSLIVLAQRLRTGCDSIVFLTTPRTHNHRLIFS